MKKSAVILLTLILLAAPLVFADHSDVSENTTTEECIGEGEYKYKLDYEEHKYGCCEGLRAFDKPNGELLCYDEERAEPACAEEGTDLEGWYYEDGELFLKEICSEEEPKDYDYMGVEKIKLYGEDNVIVAVSPYWQSVR